MVWVARYQSGSSLLAWCLLALITFAQLQNNIHFHDHNDVDLTNECTVCATVAHLDDVDTNEQHCLAVNLSQILLTPEIEAASLTVARPRAQTRAPPIS